MSVKIFLSAVSDEFRNYRDQLRSDLTRHNVEVKVEEDFKDTESVTLDKLDLYISTCDAVIQLVGDMTGPSPNPALIASITPKYPDIAEKLPPLGELMERGLGISYTQWEAWLALYHGKPLLIAQADRGAPRGPNYAPTDASRTAQQIHLQRSAILNAIPPLRSRVPIVSSSRSPTLQFSIFWHKITATRRHARHEASPTHPLSQCYFSYC